MNEKKAMKRIWYIIKFYDETTRCFKCDSCDFKSKKLRTIYEHLVAEH